MKKVVGLLLASLVFIGKTFAVRDPFDDIRVAYSDYSLNKVAIEDLSFLGAIIQKDQSWGFLVDGRENIYRVMLGQEIGAMKNRIVRIMSNGIFVYSEQQHYIFIGNNDDQEYN